jgi:leucyl-tRNA synthetase
LRLCICFIGPYEDTYPWNENGIKSCWRLVKNIYESKEKVVEQAENAALEKAFNKMVKNITEMTESLKMNTAVSEIMIFMNELKKKEKIDKQLWKSFIKVIAPFTPFVAEELWQDVNNFSKWKKENSVHLQEWPTYDKKLLDEKEIIIPVQINGKIKGTIIVEENDTEQVIKGKTKELLIGNTIVKFIYIPKKIVSVVCK